MPYKTYFECQSCGYQTPKWAGKCVECGKWNSLVETTVSTSRSKLKAQKSKAPVKSQNLARISPVVTKRLQTGIAEFDRVLGGGIVPGAVILLAGEPGVGKSTLLLQLASSLESEGDPSFRKSSLSVFYVSGEESPAQIKLRADRLRLKAEGIRVLAETDVDTILRIAKKPQLLIVDSIQALATADLSSPAGSVSQVRECAHRLAVWAKKRGSAVILVGHVTKEGAVAGPKVLEHLVDVVLNLEGDKFHTFRLLRTSKNRFGSTREIGVFEMSTKGLQEVKNPSEIFLAERLSGVAGSLVTAVLEGNRPVLLEVQALAVPTNLTHPRRVTSGFNISRLLMIVAVLQKHLAARAGGLRLGLPQKDIYVNVVGGYKITEPAADLAVAVAIISSVKNKPLDPSLCVFGEIGLSGEVRKVSQIERRAKEAKKLGFKRIISPENVRSLGEAVGVIQNSKFKIKNYEGGKL